MLSVDSGNQKNLRKIGIKLFSDEKPRCFVPEVHSGSEDDASIVNDFIEAGIEFV